MVAEIEQYSLRQTGAPFAEPVHLAEVKAHLRVEINNDDDLITRLASAARARIELATGQQLVMATWLLAKDFFAPVDLLLPRIFGDLVQIPKPPLQEVVQIQYVDTTGNLQTLDPTLYQVDSISIPGRVRPSFGNFWPATRWQLGAAKITFHAGYATPFVVSNQSSGIFTAQGRTPAAGETWRVSNSGGALPSGLATNTDYFVVNPGSGNTFQLSLSSGGTPVAVTDTGTGTSFLGVIPESLKGKIKSLAAAAYQNRELTQNAAALEAALDAWLIGDWTGELY